jgi:hypothetical protein
MKSEPKPIDGLTRKELVWAMDNEHPIVSLTIGTVKANAERAAGSNPDVANEVTRIIREITQQAASTKRKAQAIIGRYIQQVSTGPLSNLDLEVLNAICPPMAKSDDENDDENEVMDPVSPSPKYDPSKVHQEKFLSMLLRHLYSGETLGSTKLAELVKYLLERCPVSITHKKVYPGMELLESTASQLAGEYRRHYKTSCKEISKKVCIVVVGQAAITFNLHCRLTLVTVV